MSWVTCTTWRYDGDPVARLLYVQKCKTLYKYTSRYPIYNDLALQTGLPVWRFGSRIHDGSYELQKLFSCTVFLTSFLFNMTLKCLALLLCFAKMFWFYLKIFTPSIVPLSALESFFCQSIYILNVIVNPKKSPRCYDMI